MRPVLRATSALGAVLLASPLLAACTENASGPAASDSGDPRRLSVVSTDDACQVSATTAPAGNLTFDVTNQGSQVTEFYLLAADGLRIVAEIENVGPSLSRSLLVNAPAGTYLTACKPGMTGDGIRAAFDVTASSDAPQTISADAQQLVDAATTNYAAYVQDQSDQLLVKARAFVTAYEAGDDETARALYPVARTHWERIETVAESFGDLDPKTDLREADLEPGQKWTGWHRIEKDLWPPAQGYTALSPAERTTYGEDLLANLTELDSRVQGLSYTVDQIANGSRGLLEEVATGKVTGEEETWSHTDLYDFQANVDGARVGFEGVRPIVEQNNPQLATTLQQRFDALQQLLDAQRTQTSQGQGFVSYTDLTPAEVKQLSDAVNALSEPLSQLTAAVLS